MDERAVIKYDSVEDIMVLISSIVCCMREILSNLARLSVWLSICACRHDITMIRYMDYCGYTCVV